MRAIEKVELNGKTIYLKRGILGYRTVYPIILKDGSFSFANIIFGGLQNLVFLIFAFGIVGFMMYAHYHDVEAIQKNYEVIASDPLKWCHNVCEGKAKPILLFNVTQFNELIINNEDS